VRFEWDERKRRANLEKHGVDFADLDPIFAGDTVTVLDDRLDYGEYRFITFALLQGVVLAISHTETDEVIRYISAPRATSYEEKVYYKEIGQ
jgi:uncharacterized DUF497 family protein